MFLCMKLLNISIFVDVIGMVAACVWLYRLCCVPIPIQPHACGCIGYVVFLYLYNHMHVVVYVMLCSYTYTTTCMWLYRLCCVPIPTQPHACVCIGCIGYVVFLYLYNHMHVVV